MVVKGMITPEQAKAKWAAWQKTAADKENDEAEKGKKDAELAAKEAEKDSWKESAALKKAVNWASLKTDVDWDTLWGACAKYSARGQSALTACVVCLKHAPAQVDTCMNKTAEFKKERVFEQVDMDKSGQIEGAEREDLTSKLRRKSAIPAGEYAKLEKMADKDANGAFGPKEFKELVVLVRQHSPLSELPGMVAAFFRRADENADGAIAGEAEMGFISRAINHQFHLSGGVLGGLIKEADKSGDDRLEPLEFLHLVHMVRNHAGKAMNAKLHRRAEGTAVPETPAHVPLAVARGWERAHADQLDQAKPKLF
jgi:hypothetical protein